MKIDSSDEKLSVSEDQGYLRPILVFIVAAGIFAACSAWVVSPRAYGLRVLAYRCAGTLAGCAAAGFALRSILVNPSRNADFSHSSRTVVFTEKGLFKSSRKELSMRSIEMILVRRDFDVNGKEKHRLSIGTRAGDRIQLSGWRDDEFELHSIARTLEKYCRDALQGSQVEATIDIHNLARGVVEQSGSDSPHGKRDIHWNANASLG